MKERVHWIFPEREKSAVFDKANEWPIALLTTYPTMPPHSSAQAFNRR